MGNSMSRRSRSLGPFVHLVRPQSKMARTTSEHVHKQGERSNTCISRKCKLFFERLEATLLSFIRHVPQNIDETAKYGSGDRPAGQPAGRPTCFGENIRETFWGAKTSARFLASRPAGRPASRLRPKGERGGGVQVRA